MRLLFPAALALVAGVACTSPEPTVNGLPITDFFSLDGHRVWSFQSEDGSVPYLIDAEKPLEGTMSPNGVDQVFSVDMVTNCISNDETCPDGEYVMGWDMSASQSNGALLWGYRTADADVTLDPPVLLGPGRTSVGDVSTTVTGGNTWTATFAMTTECNIVWNPSWTGCMVLELDDGGANSGLAGQYWVAPGYNIVAFDIASQDARWSLQDHEYSNE